MVPKKTKGGPFGLFSTFASFWLSGVELHVLTMIGLAAVTRRTKKTERIKILKTSKFETFVNKRFSTTLKATVSDSNWRLF